MLRPLGRYAVPAAFVALVAALSAALPARAAAAVGQAARPRLVVVISIDQFRADYLTRFADLYLPARSGSKVGGFRYLMELGAYETDAHHDHYPLFTGPGHSVQLTGAPPYESGIVGNSWYDRELERTRYCVEDPASPLVGAPAPAGGTATGISPAMLRVSTLGDELKMATGGRAKVWGLAFKDRAAVLLAGRLADGVLWLDDESGRWVSSRFYRPDGTLPGWVERWNAGRKIDTWFGKEWKPSVPPAAFARLWTPGSRYAEDPYALGTGFPHEIKGGLPVPGRDFYRAFATTPFGNDYVLASARELIAEEKLGQDAIPDLLAINLSSNDYAGHAFGPDSPEVLDMSVRTDHALAGFFGFLEHAVPGGLAAVTLVVTADHGVAPIPGALKAAGFLAGAYDEAALRKAADQALVTALGPGEWSSALVESNFYLNLPALAAHGVARERAGEAAAAALAQVPGIYAAYTRGQILTGRLPATEIARRVARSFHPKVSGDVVLVADPYWVPGRLTGTTHGTPYVYDTTVPILLGGFGIRPGRYRERSSTLDIAPTLAQLLGILPPSGSEGRVLTGALR
jgi:predicted AlkP superfamily pyrophosphatase or phosphodiesterase